MSSLVPGEEFLAAVLDSIPHNICVIDKSGTVVWVNTAWVEFSRNNGRALRDERLGINYLDVCRHSAESGDGDARQVLDGITGMLDHRTGVFQFEYPCHSPTQRRWFMMQVKPLVWEGPGRFIILHQDITGRREAEDETRKQADRFKRFAYVASHDLQGPLRQISALAELLDGDLDTSGNKAAARTIGHMRDAAKQGSSLVRNILRFSSIANERLDVTWFPLRTVLEEAIDQVEQGGGAIDLSVACDRLRADEGLFRVCVSNILNNAVKYKHPQRPLQCRITSAFDAVANEYTLAFSDNGIGFDAGQSAGIFEPFTRLLASPQVEGSGIGLSFVKDIVDEHGWSIDADSTPGEGSVFTITVPGGDVSQAPDDVAEC